MIGDQAVGINEVQPLGGRTIGVVYDVVHFLDEDREADVKVHATACCYFFPLLVTLMLSMQHAFRYVAVGLPSIGGVGLLNVDHEKLDLPAEPVANLFDAPNLGAEGRSSITAEDECHGTLSAEAG